MSAERSVDVIVIGGGVAGLTAGLFAARLGRSTLVVIGLMPGGQIATIESIEDYPGFPSGVPGFDLGPSIQEQAAAAGAEFEMGEVERIEPREGGWLVQSAEGEVRARTVIFAAGSRIRTLDVPGEQRLTGKGVSHCASCDGPMLRGKPVVVVGAGDSGLQEALALAGVASAVTIVDRGAAPGGQPSYLRRASENAKIKRLADTAVEEILGADGVTGVRVRNLESGEASEIPAHAVFVYAGLQPNTALLEGLIELDPAGRVPTDLWMRTACAGLYAVGDLRVDSAGQAITAAGDGATAAIAAHRFLAGPA